MLSAPLSQILPLLLTQRWSWWRRLGTTCCCTTGGWRRVPPCTQIIVSPKILSAPPPPSLPVLRYPPHSTTFFIGWSTLPVCVFLKKYSARQVLSYQPPLLNVKLFITVLNMIRCCWWWGMVRQKRSTGEFPSLCKSCKGHNLPSSQSSLILAGSIHHHHSRRSHPHCACCCVVVNLENATVAMNHELYFWHIFQCILMFQPLWLKSHPCTCAPCHWSDILGMNLFSGQGRSGTRRTPKLKPHPLKVLDSFPCCRHQELKSQSEPAAKEPNPKSEHLSEQFSPFQDCTKLVVHLSRAQCFQTWLYNCVLIQFHIMKVTILH